MFMTDTKKYFALKESKRKIKCHACGKQVPAGQKFLNITQAELRVNKCMPRLPCPLCKGGGIKNEGMQSGNR